MTREKEFKTIHEQIIIQKNRNLKIPDELQMESFIQQKNYHMRKSLMYLVTNLASIFLI